MKKDTTKLFNLKGVIVDKLEITDTKIIIFVRSPKNKASCPKCGSCTKNIHQRKHRIVMHDSLNERSVVLNIAYRRFMCHKCRSAFTEKNIPGVSRSKFTEHFRNRVVNSARTESFDAVAKKYKISGPTFISFLREVKREIDWPKIESA